MTQLILIFCLTLTTTSTFAKYSLPSNLNAAAQETVAQDFGFGSATKMNLDPRPLGGYQGFQVSVSRDLVNVSRLKTIGTSANQDDYFATSTMMVGKGLFYNIDSFFQMTPPQNDDFSSYGGLIRGTFWNSEIIDLHIGGLVHGSMSQFANTFGSNIVGLDLYAYLGISKFTFSVGLGQAKGIYTFVGSGLVSPATTENTKVDLSSSHGWSGVSYRVDRWIVSAMYENYFDSMYSFKFAYNF